MTQQEFSDALRALVTRFGSENAAAGNYGFSAEVLRLWMRGKSSPRQAAHRFALAAIFGCGESELPGEMTKCAGADYTLADLAVKKSLYAIGRMYHGNLHLNNSDGDPAGETRVQGWRKHHEQYEAKWKKKGKALLDTRNPHGKISA